MNKLVCVVLAYYNPSLDLFLKQVESIIAQTYSPLILNIFVDSDKNDLLTSPEVLNLLKGKQINIYHNSQRMGFRDNFLNGVMKSIEKFSPYYVSFSDQDDYWYPNKIEDSINLLKKNSHLNLVHTDSRVIREIDKTKEIICESLWRYEDRNINNNNIIDVIFRNVATGASIVAKSDFILKHMSIPSMLKFHDHWFAVCASSEKCITHLNSVTYDYIQHQSNVVGANKLTPSIAKFSSLVSHYDYLRIFFKHFNIKDIDIFIYIFKNSKKYFSDYCLLKSFVGFATGKLLRFFRPLN